MSNLPDWVNLCGIGYRVTVAEGLIIFEEEICMSGCHTRICFERADDIGVGGCWYLQYSDTWDRIMVSHILKAYEMICEVYGGNHEMKKPV